MIKRPKPERIRKIRLELLTRMRKRFPLVELIDTEVRPAGTIVYRVYAPYDDGFEVLETISGRLVDLAVDDKLDVLVVPLREKPARRAA